MPKPEISINVTRFTQDEVVRAVASECPDFEHIPKADQWIMALHAMGVPTATISSLTGRMEDGVKKAIDRFAPMTSILPDGAKAKLNQRMVWNAVGSYVSVLSDKNKIDKLNPYEAMRVVKEMPSVLRELMSIEEEWHKHREKMNAMNYDGFAKSLKEPTDG